MLAGVYKFSESRRKRKFDGGVVGGKIMARAVQWDRAGPLYSTLYLVTYSNIPVFFCHENGGASIHGFCSLEIRQLCALDLASN